MIKYFKPSRLLRLIHIASIFGLSLGVAALVVVMSVADGFEARIQEAVSKTLAPIMLFKHHITDEEIGSVKEVCENCELIKFKMGQGILLKNSKTGFVQVDAVPFNDDLILQKMGTPFDGTWPGKNQMVIGKELAEDLDIKLHDHVYVYADQKGSYIKKEIEVVGIQNYGYGELNRRLVMVPLEDSFESFRDGVKVYPKKDFDKLYSKIMDKFDYPWVIKTWKDMNSNLIEAIAYETLTLFLVMLLIVIIAVFNVTAAILIMVFERQSEFSILRAMGLRKKEMVSQLIRVSTKLSIKGVGLGLILGLSLVLILKYFPVIKIPPKVYGFETLPTAVNPFMLLIIVISSLLIALVGALIPSLIMANRPIVQGLIRD